LTPAQFRSVLTGSFARLKAILYEKISLDVASIPKKVIIRGTKNDLSIARAILHGRETPASPGTSPPRCPPTSPGTCGICWTEATDPLKTHCSHIYCRECFLHQVASVGEHDIPLRCCGDEGKCSHVSSSHLATPKARAKYTVDLWNRGVTRFASIYRIRDLVGDQLQVTHPNSPVRVSILRYSRLSVSLSSQHWE
jgi:hypothetical protein